MAKSVAFDFTGKTALVTGGGRGIGRAICEALAEAGAKTFALSKTQKNLDDLVAKYPSIYPVCVDLSNWDETRKAVESIGPVDLLVNNAAVLSVGSFLEATKESLDQAFEVNFKAVFNVSQVVARGMVARKYPGSIVNISSVLSYKAISNVPVYGAMKGALDTLTLAMALELGHHQIRVNSVNPTAVHTDMSEQYLSSNTEEIEKLRSSIALGRFAEVSEVVGPVLYLLSDSASMVNGIRMPIDGGDQ